MGKVPILMQLDLPLGPGEIHIVAQTLQILHHKIRFSTAVHSFLYIFPVDIVAGGFSRLFVLSHRAAGCFLWVADYGQTML